jgi:hypothetical protein
MRLTEINSPGCFRSSFSNFRVSCRSVLHAGLPFGPGHAAPASREKSIASEHTHPVW